MKTKYNIGNEVKIRVCETPGIVVDIKYEVIWADKEGSPCKGIFTQLELDNIDTKRSFGFVNENKS